MDAVRRKPEIQRPKSSGVVVPHKPKWHQRLAALLVYGLIRSVAATVRFEMNDGSGLFNGWIGSQDVLIELGLNRLIGFVLQAGNLQQECGHSAKDEAANMGPPGNPRAGPWACGF